MQQKYFFGTWYKRYKRHKSLLYAYKQAYNELNRNGTKGSKGTLPVLNRYEGWPRLYRHEKMNFELDGKSYEGMAYLMNHGEISPPSQQYYNTILQGYRENGLDESFLQRALENSLQMDLLDEEIDEDFDIEEFDYIEYDDFQMEL